MDPEVLIKKGQLLTAEQEAAKYASRINGLRTEIRIYLADHGNPEDLEARRVHELSQQLLKAVDAYESTLQVIASIRESLNMPRYERRSDRRRP